MRTAKLSHLDAEVVLVPVDDRRLSALPRHIEMDGAQLVSCRRGHRLLTGRGRADDRADQNSPAERRGDADFLLGLLRGRRCLEGR